MVTEKNIDSESMSTSAREPLINIDQLHGLVSLPRVQFDTRASQSLFNRLAYTAKQIYKNSSQFSDTQLILILGALLNSSLTIQNTESNYRLDKSPSATISNNIQDWYKIDQEGLYQYTDIVEQPRYSYNKTYILAKKIGFPTEFEL